MLRKLSLSKSLAAAAPAAAATSLAKGLVMSEEEAAQVALVSGALSVLERVGPQKVWRGHFMALGKRPEGGLGLYTFSDASALGGLWKSSTPKIKVMQVLELEEGCEVRAMDPADVPGQRDACFMLVTAKSTMIFQAASEEARQRWLADLGREIQRDMEGHLLEQKFSLLRRGATMTWHRPAGALSVKVCVSGDALRLGDVSVALRAVESVVAGKDADALRGSAAFHFNCFVVNLREPEDALYKGCSAIGLEAPKQSMRDEWVSAMEAALLGAAAAPSDPAATPAAVAAAAAAAPKAAGGGELLAVVPGSPRGKEAGPKLGLGKKKGASQVFDASPRMGRSDAAVRQSSNDAADGGSDAENVVPASALPVAAGVGEFFKQKVKLGAGFPYSACISFAMETTLSGERAGSVVTPERDVAAAEFGHVQNYTKLELPASASSPLPPLSGSPAAAPAQDKKGQKPTVFEMTDYAPSAFKELRNRWEVSDLMYYRSLSKLSGDGAVGDGKSGMLFFFTQDRRYVLKTVKPNEMSVLVDKGMLGGYLRHMLDNPNSLICRFFGLYRFKMGPKGQSREIILVCMQNSFDTRLVLHEKYDLKGSTRNRWCTPRFGSVLKDLNFGNNRIALDAEERVEFLKQCERDTALMESFNVMDYSLLLGIHKPPEEDAQRALRNLLLLAMASHLEDRRVAGLGAKSGRPTRWQRDFGGVEGRLDGQPQVYIMCIIDILQAYDTGKKLENLIKSQMSEDIGKKEISAVNPKTYRERFLQYLERITVPVEGQNAMVQAGRRALRLKLNEEDAGQEGPRLSGGRRNTVTVKRTMLQTVGEESSRQVLEKQQLLAPVGTRDSRSSLGAASGLGSGGEAKPRGDTLIDDGDKLKEEIARAVQEAEKSKQADGGGAAYTEVLEDGTEITVLESGGFIQLNPDGTTIRSFVDGRVHQTNSDGTTIETDPDGNVVQRMPDGTEIVRKDSEAGPKVQKNPDGSVIEIFPDGSTTQRGADGTVVKANARGDRETHFPNGTVVERLVSGLVTQTNADGVRIVSYPEDGRRVQYDLSGVVLTSFADGATKQEDANTGIRIETSPKGTEKHYLPGGVLLTVQNGKTVKGKWVA